MRWRSDGFTTGEAAQVTGLSERQVRYLVKNGIALPSIKAATQGSLALYDFFDVLTLATLAELRALSAGELPLKRAGQVDELLQSLRDQEVTEVYVLLDSSRCWAISDERELLQGIGDSPATAVLGLGRIERELRRRLSQIGIRVPLDERQRAA